MATPQFDSNAWYSLRNAGTQAYLGCNSISICGADGSDLSTFERFQINAVGGSTTHYIRPEARNMDDNGQPFCINLSSGQPSLALCNDNSAVWGTGYWNGADAGDGLFFFDTQRGESQRLHLDENGVWSLMDYNGQSSEEQDLMRWSTSSLAAINDPSYSTVPAAIGSAGPIVTSSTTAITNTTATSSSITSASTTASLPSTQSTSSLAALPTSNATNGTSTTVVVTTPTPTAATSQSTSRASTAPIASPTGTSGAHQSVSNARAVAALAIMLTIPQLITFLS